VQFNNLISEIFMIKNYFAAAALAALSIGAQASVTGGIGNQNPTSFIDLSSTTDDITVTGGQLYAADTNALPYAAIPMDVATSTVSQGAWLGVGPGNGAGNDAVVGFGTPTSFVSFLWGSPDTYNALTVTTNLGSYLFQSSSLLGLVYNGNQDFASYVGFTADAGEFITSLTFSSSSNAFEASNFSVTAPVPEPETYALMLAGLGVIGFVARRRRA
jgi:PEP-CTERM motif